MNVRNKPATRLEVFKKAVLAVPDDRLLLESDCKFLTCSRLLLGVDRPFRNRGSVPQRLMRDVTTCQDTRASWRSPCSLAQWHDSLSAMVTSFGLGDDPTAADAHLRLICAAVAEAKGWSIAHTAAVTTANSIRFAEARRPS